VTPDKRNVANLIFDDAEVLDFVDPFEVFTVAAHKAEPAAFNVYTVAEKSPISTRGRLSVNPHYTPDTYPVPDILLVPGGWGVHEQINNTRIAEWIKDQAARCELLLSICTGAQILARAGLLDGPAATTHYSTFN
jgi:transcriptional regulator GlxA family with amidase domain